MRTSTEGRRNGIQRTVWSQLDEFDFADDLALLSHSHAQMQDKTSCLESTSAKLGLHMHNGKTKIIRMKHASNSPVTEAWRTAPWRSYLFYLFRRHSWHTEGVCGRGGGGRCRCGGKSRQSTNSFSGSQESLEFQRDWKIHQVEDIQHRCEISTTMWIGNIKNNSSNSPYAANFHQHLSAQNLYPVARVNKKRGPVEDSKSRTNGRADP